MKASLRWLGALAPGLDDADAGTVAERLAARGAPVEEILPLAEDLGDVVVARVDEVRPHPNADRLRLCSVVTGPDAQPLQVVCGAPNVEAGRLYPLAPVGASLPGDVSIRKAKLRGEISEGMLCSARELGLGVDHQGIMTLPDDLELGAPLVEALGLRDSRLDVEVTANRGDLLSHLGLARELVGQAALRLPQIPSSAGEPGLRLERGDASSTAAAGGVTVRIEDTELCPRYLGAVVRGVRVGPSPGWLQARLRAAGVRPINNVVDATNYVLLELGQPLHAFDLDRIAGDTIVVRRARAAESSFVTLDDVERKLDEETLVIADAERPVAIAGVMGGRDSEVDDDTTDVLLECAWFDPGSVRSTRRRLVLSTDASYRFERAVDADAMDTALRRAVEIVLATAGGRVEPEVADAGPHLPRAEPVELRVARVGHLLGVSFSADEVEALLTPLGFEVVGRGEGGGGGAGKGGAVLRVAVPGWRARDVTREVDLIEEVARTHGYDRFPQELGAFRPGTVPDHPLFRLEDDLRDVLVARGLHEAQTPAFVPRAEGEVRVVNPVSREEDHLRRELLPSLLRRVEHNWSHGVRDVRLFEIGTSFARTAAGEPPHEETRLSLALTGRTRPVHWSGAAPVWDVWDLKGLAEEVVHRFRAGAGLRPGAPDGYGVDAVEGFTVVDASGTAVGWGGRVRADAVDAPAWADPVFALELSLPAEPAPAPLPEHVPLPPYPAVERDLALLVPDALPAARVGDAVREAAGPHLVEMVLFDRYAGEGVPEGVRSLAWRLRFQSTERTLTDPEVDAAWRDVVSHLREALDVRPRE